MKKIFIVCPANFKTGGPELLHQLANLYQKNGINAQIAYVDIRKDEEPIYEEFKKYISSYIDFNKIEDLENNIIIFPEVYTRKLNCFKKAKKVIWWLSVDNCDQFKYIPGWKDKIKRIANFITRNIFLNNCQSSIFGANLHLYQSEYARLYLKSVGISNYLPLSDYINDSFFERRFDDVSRDDNVLYNPKKGLEFTLKIKEYGENLNFIPIENLTTIQVSSLLLKSKVYIDFGNHPGKDRFPREAAMSGCCVITGLKGSAGNKFDVPIPKTYKFEDVDENLGSIVEKIEYCIQNYDIAQKDFSNYKNMILNEKLVFEKEALSLVEVLYKL